MLFEMMKKIVKFVLSFGLSLSLFAWISSQVDAVWGGWFENNDPIQVLDNVVDNANSNPSEDVQDTKMDTVTSMLDSCWVDSRFTFSNTLCYISNQLHYYLQYVVYIALAVATIFLIWNGFQLVVSNDKQKQIWKFKQNLINIGLWVILVIAFYIIIDIFVSVVNLIAK